MGFYHKKIITKETIKTTLLEVLIDAIFFLYPLEVLGNKEEVEANQKKMSFYYKGIEHEGLEFDYFWAIGNCYFELAERLKEVKKQKCRKYILLKYAKRFGILVLCAILFLGIFLSIFLVYSDVLH